MATSRKAQTRTAGGGGGGGEELNRRPPPPLLLAQARLETERAVFFLFQGVSFRARIVCTLAPPLVIDISFECRAARDEILRTGRSSMSVAMFG